LRSGETTYRTVEQLKQTLAARLFERSKTLHLDTKIRHQRSKTYTSEQFHTFGLSLMRAVKACVTDAVLLRAVQDQFNRLLASSGMFHWPGPSAAEVSPAPVVSEVVDQPAPEGSVLPVQP
jgi:hypothetical protein